MSDEPQNQQELMADIPVSAMDFTSANFDLHLMNFSFILD